MLGTLQLTLQRRVRAGRERAKIMLNCPSTEDESASYGRLKKEIN